MRLAGPLFVFTVSLAACATVTPAARGDAPIVSPPEAPCSDGALAPFVGQKATQDLGTQMLAASGARVMRWVPKGGMVTMDFRGDRLTVRLSETNTVEGAACG